MDNLVLVLFILIICNIMLVRIFPYNNQVEFFDNYIDEVEIVLARYEEDISWINEYPFNRFKVTVYNKGSDLDEGTCKNSQCKFEKLPNVGRCDHTYLYHIVQNYSFLAPVTIFLPASCMDTHKKGTTLKVMKLVIDTKNTVIYGTKLKETVRKTFETFYLDEWKATNKQNSSVNPEKKLKPCQQRPFGVWYDKNFDKNIPIYYSVFWGIFAVARKHILQKPREFYENLLHYVDDHSNPEAGHYIERAWCVIFFPFEDECFYQRI